MSERPAPYLDDDADPDEATVALLKAYGHFERCMVWSSESGHGTQELHYAACALIAQDRLIALLAPSWPAGRRAAAAMLTEPDAAIAEIERAARDGRAS